MNWGRPGGTPRHDSLSLLARKALIAAGKAAICLGLETQRLPGHYHASSSLLERKPSIWGPSSSSSESATSSPSSAPPSVAMGASESLWVHALAAAGGCG